ncbi:hypothetical protein P3T37_000993 [Kitasatospora sp. MAA4]|nr:hypothetical protein [Kitasatospora sp. MAA4]
MTMIPPAGRGSQRAAVEWQRPQARHPLPDPCLPLRALVADSGRKAFRQATWRHGSKGPMRSRFRVLTVRPAGVAVRTYAMAQAGGAGGWDGVLPEATLLSEWPTGQNAPTEYWLTSLPADTPTRHLVRLAKMRWRIEHDYREMTLYQVLDQMQDLLSCWTGTCHTCQRPLPRSESTHRTRLPVPT